MAALIVERHRPFREPPPAGLSVTWSEITSSRRARSRTKAMSSARMRATCRSYVVCVNGGLESHRPVQCGVSVQHGAGMVAGMRTPIIASSAAACVVGIGPSGPCGALSPTGSTSPSSSPSSSPSASDQSEPLDQSGTPACTSTAPTIFNNDGQSDS